MKNKIYTYRGVTHGSEREVRNAVFESERKALPKLLDQTGWAKFGVDVTTVEPKIKEKTLDQLKGLKLGEIGAMFDAFRKSSNAYVHSSLGFNANANTTAFENVSGLIAQLQYRQEQGEIEPTVGFMTYDNEVVNLKLSNLKTLQMEISLYGTRAYEYKWAKKAQVRACTSKEELEQVVFDMAEIGH